MLQIKTERILFPVIIYLITVSWKFLVPLGDERLSVEVKIMKVKVGKIPTYNSKKNLNEKRIPVIVCFGSY